MASGLHFSSTVSEGNMDKVLDKLSKGFSKKERWQINRKAAKVYETSLKYHVNLRMRPLREPPRPVKDEETGKYHARNRDDLLNAIGMNEEHNGAASVGFTRKSKKAYLGRFLNDGWDPRNQHGGPYQHVEGEHFFEKSAQASGEEVKRVELENLKKVLKDKGL